MQLNDSYWENRYLTNDIGWDIGEVSRPLKAYFDQLTNKDLKILIPGGGNAYEAEYLLKQGFKNTFVVDVSKTALSNLKKRVPEFPENQLIHKNFFDLEATFDLIIEQTFFCALNPNLRDIYAVKMHELLKENGKLVGLLFNIPLNKTHPPFGGSKAEYLDIFEKLFKMEIFETCYNSINKRAGNELFIKFVKKQSKTTIM